MRSRLQSVSRTPSARSSFQIHQSQSVDQTSSSISNSSRPTFFALPNVAQPAYQVAPSGWPEIFVIVTLAARSSAAPSSPPALNDDLLVREEVDGVLTLAVQDAKERLLPAAEGEESHGSGEAYV